MIYTGLFVGDACTVQPNAPDFGGPPQSYTCQMVKDTTASLGIPNSTTYQLFSETKDTGASLLATHNPVTLEEECTAYCSDDINCIGYQFHAGSGICEILGAYFIPDLNVRASVAPGWTAAIKRTISGMVLEGILSPNMR